MFDFNAEECTSLDLIAIWHDLFGPEFDVEKRLDAHWATLKLCEHLEDVIVKRLRSFAYAKSHSFIETLTDQQLRNVETFCSSYIDNRSKEQEVNMARDVATSFRWHLLERAARV